MSLLKTGKNGKRVIGKDGSPADTTRSNVYNLAKSVTLTVTLKSALE